MKKALVQLGVLGTLALAGQIAQAGDIEAGKAKAAACAGCHGPAGKSSVPAYPHLAGQQREYLVKQLKAFKDGSRADPVMAAMAKPLSDAEIANLAAYYASLKP